MCVCVCGGGGGGGGGVGDRVIEFLVRLVLFCFDFHMCAVVLFR